MYNYVWIKDRKSKINNFISSERKVVFMLRGLARSYKGWLGFEEDLSAEFDVICVDLPGVGLSKNEKHLYHIESMADQMIAVIHNLNLNNFFIVAPSLGSLVTYEILRKLTGNRIRGLVIIVPSHSGIGLRRLSTRGVKTLVSVAFVSKEVKLAMLKDLLIGKTIDNRDPFKEDVNLERRWKDQITQDMEDLGVKGQLAQVGAAAKYTSKKGLNIIKEKQIPLKVLIASEDKMIPVHHEKAIYEYMKHQSSELIEMKNSGHDFIVTHREQVREVVTNFVNNVNYKFNTELKTENINKDIILKKIKPKIELNKNKKGILFFVSTLIAGTMLLLVTKKYKK